MKRLIITGGSGLLALNWACCMRTQYEIYLGTHVRSVKLSGTQALPVNLENVDELTSQFRSLSPAVVIHTAGLTNVDECERNPEAAFHANAELARHVAQAARQVGAKLIHISTDHLFSGMNKLCTEDAVPEPVNVYAETKLKAEEWVVDENPDALVVRTNFFGWGHAKRQSLSDWIIYSLRADKTVALFDDVYFTPLLADTLAVTAHRLADMNERGIFHIVGDERISKYEFGCKIANAFGLPTRLILRSTFSDSGLSAARPRDMSLHNGKTCRLLNAGLGDVNTFFAMLRNQEEQGRAGELRKAIRE